MGFGRGGRSDSGEEGKRIWFDGSHQRGKKKPGEKRFLQHQGKKFSLFFLKVSFEKVKKRKNSYRQLPRCISVKIFLGQEVHLSPCTKTAPWHAATHRQKTAGSTSTQWCRTRIVEMWLRVREKIQWFCAAVSQKAFKINRFSVIRVRPWHSFFFWSDTAGGRIIIRGWGGREGEGAKIYYRPFFIRHDEEAPPSFSSAD